MLFGLNPLATLFPSEFAISKAGKGFGCVCSEMAPQVWKSYACSNDLGEFALPTSHGAGLSHAAIAFH